MRAGTFPRVPSRSRESGFSLAEVLVAAFVMAIGILGLAMFQTLALRTQATSTSLNQAVEIGMRILEQAEILGRNSVISSRAGVTPPTLSPNYFGTTAITQHFDGSASPVTTGGVYTALITPATAGTGLVAPGQGVGGIALVTVKISWQEAIGGSNQTTTRSITVNRRINYATS